MADEHDADVLELDQPLDEQGEGEPSDDIEIEVEGEEPQDDLDVEQPDDAPLVTRLRGVAKSRAKALADRDREIAELRRANSTSQVKTPPDPGPKPTLWEEGEGDEEKYDKLKSEWDERVRAVADYRAEQERTSEKQNAAFKVRYNAYRLKAASIGIKNIDEAENAIISALPNIVGTKVVQIFDEPEKVFAALYRNPSRLAAIAAEPDVEKQFYMLAKLERSVKVVNKRRPPEPEAETIQRGSAPIAGSTMTQAKFTKRLAELEDEASRNGGKRTKIREFKNQWKGKFA